MFDLKQDKKIHIYSISDSNGTLQELQTVDNTGEACDMMYSPDGEYLATAGADRYVRCFKLPNYEVRNNIYDMVVIRNLFSILIDICLSLEP